MMDGKKDGSDGGTNRGVGGWTKEWSEE